MQCPKCREEIVPGAVVCSHCGCALSLPGGAAPADFPALFTAAVNLWTGNLVDLVATLVEVGSDPWPYSSLQAPTLVFEGVDFSGA